ncbi:GMP synthase [glutamine-hydrolyzing] [Planctomycetes bacterium Pla163]|uniref:GMP synthase [glutamine-hydrolyzing] n=1 Tax=Rohdeia mirabilis TaxID=2528008 RepID=A0A518CZ32_9BACT|nr:GMP synthase [glutamine-hydrolyzing] [Planctomycetes bacterium Pla163]
MNPIAIVLCGRTVPRVRERRGDFDLWFGRALGAPRTVIEADLGEELPPPRTFAGAVLSGSPAMVTDREPWSLALEDWCRTAHGTLPLLGVCYGHQLLAQALGGRVADNPRGTEVGEHRVELTDAAAADPLFAGLGPALAVFESHTQSVLEPPTGAVVLARNEHDGHQALRLGPTTWGVQFHPEFDAPITAGYLEARRSSYEDQGIDVDHLLGALTDDLSSRVLLERFATLCRRPR